MEFFLNEAESLSCTKQVPLVVDVRAATEVAVRENASWCRWYFAVLNIQAVWLFVELVFAFKIYVV